jgi:hypothetical protein
VKHASPPQDPVRFTAALAAARLAAGLGLLVLASFSIEQLRPGHHVHVGPDGDLHHHHAFLGTHTHDAPAEESSSSSPAEPEPSSESDPAGFTGLLTGPTLPLPAVDVALAPPASDLVGLLPRPAIVAPLLRTRRVGGARAPPA